MRISLILVVLLAVAAATPAMGAAPSASVHISPQVWTWRDGKSDSVDRRLHARTTLALQVPMTQRFAAEVFAHTGDVYSGFVGGAGFTLLGAGPASLVALLRHHQTSITTDQSYEVRGFGYGLRAGLTLLAPALEVEYVTVPAGTAKAGTKEWDVSGHHYAVGVDLFGFGPLRVRAGYVHEAFSAAGQGSWTNQGALLGAAIRF